MRNTGLTRREITRLARLRRVLADLNLVIARLEALAAMRAA